jgi:hypothetical protein
MRHRNGNFKSLTLPHQAIEFELDDFSYHIELAMAAGSMRTPVRNPELNHVIIEDDDEVIDLSFRDHPMIRAVFAVKDSMKDSQRFSSFLWRFWALMELVNDQRLRPWCQPTADGSGTIMMHTAVIDVGRRLRLSKRGSFNVIAFVKLLNQSPFPLTDEEAPSEQSGNSSPTLLDEPQTTPPMR